MTLYDTYQYYLGLGDPRLEKWWSMDTPVKPVLIMIAYWAVLVSIKEFMKYQKPFELRYFLIAYNFIQVCGSFYICLEIYTVAYLSRYNLTCEPVDYSNNPLAMRMLTILYYYYLSKLVDLIDTVVFAFRKKDNQITFLHLYHHSSIIPSSWLGVKYAGGGNTFYLSGFNSLIHTIMYSYYGLAAIGPHMQKYLWWKKYLTQFQLIQFITSMIHSFIAFYSPTCKFSKFISFFYIVYGFILLMLFSNFYFQTYSKKQRDRRARMKLEAIANGKYDNQQLKKD